MKYFGYLLKPIFRVLSFGLSIWIWQIKFLVSLFIPDGGRSLAGDKFGPRSGWGTDRQFTLRNGFLDSYIAGSKFRIDGQRWVYEVGMAGKRVGRVSEEGLWRSEANEVIARFDGDGVLREHGNGFMDGVLGSQSGTGQELGRID